MTCRSLFLFLITFLIFSCDDPYDSETGILKVSLDQVKSKIEIVNEIDNDGGSFIFITDTHGTTNCWNSPQQIRYILQQTSIDKVIWGGDAISAYGNNIEQQWDWHFRAFDEVLKGYGNIYKVRGNHDFTIRTSVKSDEGRTLSQHQTFQYLSEGSPGDIVRNTDDSDGCYYYFDDDVNKIRFIILDTNDSLEEGNVAWGVINGVHDKQLDWVANTAIAFTPKNYGIVFVSHIPITDTTTQYYSTYTNLLQLVNAVNTRSNGSIGTINYDFSSLENVRVLLYLSGHQHHDIQTYQNGVLHVVTACDTAYSDYLSDPFVVDKSGRYGANEQCFDAVCIDKDKGSISFIRFGVGGNRIFHLTPIYLKVGEELEVGITQKGDSFTWHSYNSSGNVYSDGIWTLKNDIVVINDQGVVKGLNKGEAIVLNMNEKGDKEFYNILVE